MSTSAALAYARREGPRFVADLKRFVRFASISADPRRAGDIARCAAWLADHFRHIGLADARVIPTRGWPVVLARWAHAPDRPTVLVYGHYDVQPVDPLAEWHSPPFEPVLRGDALIGRGTSDDKGQLMAHVNAVAAWLASQRRLPVNVTFLVEGEEETGSRHLSDVLWRYRRALAADVAVMSDTVMIGPEQPALTHAVRGDLYLELAVSGPHHDLHSGNFGGAVHNPAQALCEIIATFHDKAGRIAIPGVYDQVRRCSAVERRRMAADGAPDALILEDAAVARGWGEPGYSLYERLAVRPALTVNGITAGYRGPGKKGVIPARALAKLSFRLVPDQTPAEIDRLFRDHVARVAPPSVRAVVRTVTGARPAVVDPRHPAMRAAALAYRLGFGTPAAVVRSGGTIPVVGLFRDILRVPTVLMGFALPNDRMHAPNERLHLPTFFNAIATAIWFLAAVGATPRGRAQRHDPAITDPAVADRASL